MAWHAVPKGFEQYIINNDKQWQTIDHLSEREESPSLEKEIVNSDSHGQPIDVLRETGESPPMEQDMQRHEKPVDKPELAEKIDSAEIQDASANGPGPEQQETVSESQPPSFSDYHYIVKPKASKGCVRWCNETIADGLYDAWYLDRLERGEEGLDEDYDDDGEVWEDEHEWVYEVCKCIDEDEDEEVLEKDDKCTYNF